MYADEWSDVVNMVQSVLNNYLSMRLNKRTPRQVFTGYAEPTPLVLKLKDDVPVNTPCDKVKISRSDGYRPLKLSSGCDCIVEEDGESSRHDHLRE
jgi:hypothetical protein